MSDATDASGYLERAHTDLGGVVRDGGERDGGAAGEESLPATGDEPRELVRSLVDDARALIGRAESRLQAIDAAIAELEAGIYGRCEVCGGAIDALRLSERASERRCHEHAGAPVDARLF